MLYYDVVGCTKLFRRGGARFGVAQGGHSDRTSAGQRPNGFIRVCAMMHDAVRRCTSMYYYVLECHEMYAKTPRTARVRTNSADGSCTHKICRVRQNPVVDHSLVIMCSDVRFGTEKYDSVLCCTMM